MSGGGRISSSTTRADALTIQSSTAGMCIPWLRGMHRVPGNLLWYGDFKSISSYESSGGKGGSPKVEKVSYQASLVMGLCHGQIADVPRIWKGKGVTSPGALGLTVRTGALGQSVWSPLSGKGVQALGYSGLAYLGAYQYSLGDTASVENHSAEVQHASAYSVTGAVPDVDPADFTAELLTDVALGAGVPSAMLADWSTWSDYCRAADLLMSPLLTTQTSASDALEMVASLTNTAIVWSGGKLRMVPYGDQAMTANGRTFTPDLTPVYSLNDQQLLAMGQPPIKRRLKTPADRYNIVDVEYKDRSADYAIAVVSAKDITDINANGPRPDEPIEAHWITRGTVARLVAELRKQRSLLVIGEYEIRLPVNFALVECMDLLQLTDAELWLDQTPVRIKEITEEGDESLTVVCEDFPAGVASAPRYATQGSAGFTSAAYDNPPSVTSLQPFEAPGVLASGAVGLEIWTAVRNPGGSWGGATIWVSLDGTHYRAIGRVEGGARMGYLSAAVDTAGDLSLQVSGMSGSLTAASATDATALATLCYIGGAHPEFVAFQGAALTGAGSYTLSGLVRGALGSTADSHESGAPFVRVDDAIAKSGPLDVSMIGKQIYIKATSFNQFGAMEQSLAAVAPFAYTVTGDMILPAGDGGFSLQATSLVFTYGPSGAPLPADQTIALKAIVPGGVGNVTFEAELFNELAGSLGTVTLLGTGNVRSIDLELFDVAAYCVVKATLGSDSDQVTLVRLQDGVNAVSGFLTNEAHVVSTANDGTGGDYTHAGGVFKVFNGRTDITGTSAVVYTIRETAGIDGMAITGAGVYSMTGTSENEGTATLRATVGAVIIDRVFSISRSRTGAQGAAGIAGAPGANGQTTYFHLRWSNDGGATFTGSGGQTPGAYMGVTTSTNPVGPTSVGAYTWTLVKGSDGTNGTPGAPGANGQTQYLHIKYSNDGGSTFTGNSGENVGAYMGTCVDFNVADPTSVGAYTWALIKGADGSNGIQGPAGANGQSTYLHVKWSNDGGSTFTSAGGETPGAYIGTCTDFNVADPTYTWAYTWALVKGADGTNGIQGPAGANGQSTYLHIKWSNDGGSTFTSAGGETPGAYIGTCTDFNIADPTYVGAYTWALIKGADGATGPQGPSGPSGPVGTPPPAPTVSIAGGDIEAYRGNGGAGYGSRTATPSGGTGPYSYQWSIMWQTKDNTSSSGFVSISNANTATVSVTGSATNNILMAQIECQVSDYYGQKGSATFMVWAQHGTPL